MYTRHNIQLAVPPSGTPLRPAQNSPSLSASAASPPLTLFPPGNDSFQYFNRQPHAISTFSKPLLKKPRNFNISGPGIFTPTGSLRNVTHCYTKKISESDRHPTASHLYPPFFEHPDHSPSPARERFHHTNRTQLFLRVLRSLLLNSLPE